VLRVFPDVRRRVESARSVDRIADMPVSHRTQTESAEDALAIVHQTLLGEALDASRLLAFAADEQMRYVAVNSRVCTVLGYTRQELLKLRVPDVACAPSAPDEFAELVETGFRAGEALLRAKSGETFPFHYFASEAEIAGLRFYLAFGTVGPGS
jgi:PAS domain S-box-containing protein